MSKTITIKKTLPVKITTVKTGPKFTTTKIVEPIEKIKKEKKDKIPTDLTKKQLEKLSVSELKNICKEKKLKISGIKSLLILRILGLEKSSDELDEMTVKELKELCKKRGLSISGTRATLIDRLLGNESSSDSDDDISNDFNINLNGPVYNNFIDINTEMLKGRPWLENSQYF